MGGGGGRDGLLDYIISSLGQVVVIHSPPEPFASLLAHHIMSVDEISQFYMLGSQENCPPNIFLGIFRENQFLIFSLHFDIVRFEHKTYTTIYIQPLMVTGTILMDLVNVHQAANFVHHLKLLFLAQSGLIPCLNVRAALGQSIHIYQSRTLVGRAWVYLPNKY